METTAYRRLWHDYISAMAACLLQLRASVSTEGATDTTSQRLVCRLLLRAVSQGSTALRIV